MVPDQRPGLVVRRAGGNSSCASSQSSVCPKTPSTSLS